MAATNLLFHVANILLLYRFVALLFESAVAAWWAAFGFALLFPANSWAVMWISTRAHVITTTFYLAALIATIHFARSQQARWGVAVTLCFAAAVFAKESGATLPAAIGLVLAYEWTSKPHSVRLVRVVSLCAALLAVLGGYALLRAQSGAVPIHLGSGDTYGYSTSPIVLIDNVSRYALRTYGYLAAVVLMIAWSERLAGTRPRFAALRKKDTVLSVVLFLITLSPLIPLVGRSAIYTYLPGIAAAVLFGQAARALLETGLDSTSVPVHGLLTRLPVIAIVVVYGAFTIGQGWKWKQMAEVDTSVLRQVMEQQPTSAPRTMFVLMYKSPDHVHRFPEGFSTWGFRFAVKTLYKDRSLDGAIVAENDTLDPNGYQQFTRFVYSLDSRGEPLVVKAGP